MKLGVLTNVVGNMPLEDALKYFKSMGIQMVEIGCGGYPGKDHCDPEVLLHDEAKYQEFCDTIKKYDMEVSAFSCHGNPIHPNKELAAAYDKDMRNAVLMAASDQLLLRLPGRLRDLSVSKLGCMRMAGRFR